jgi:hypothetical protein
MALRWIRTIEKSPHMFSTRERADNDWLLYCGRSWQVGRVHENLEPAGRVGFVWSLTGTHTPEAPGEKHGNAATVDAAKEQLVVTFRAWAAWAGIRPDTTEAPRWVPTVQHEPQHLVASYDDPSDWLLFSGGFVVGRVHQPATGARHDPHWMLWVLTAASPAPFDQQGWAASVEDAKGRLIVAWCDFLAWADLPVPATLERVT